MNKDRTVTLLTVVIRSLAVKTVVPPDPDADWTQNTEDMASAVIDVNGQMYGITVAPLSPADLDALIDSRPRVEAKE